MMLQTMQMLFFKLVQERGLWVVLQYVCALLTLLIIETYMTDEMPDGSNKTKINVRERMLLFRFIFLASGVQLQAPLPLSVVAVP